MGENMSIEEANFASLADLQENQYGLQIKGVITKKGNVRTFDRYGKQGKVCDLSLHAQDVEVALTLWDDQIDQVDVGDTIILNGAYTKMFRDQLKIQVSRKGSIERVETQQSLTTSSAEPAAVIEEVSMQELEAQKKAVQQKIRKRNTYKEEMQTTLSREEEPKKASSVLEKKPQLSLPEEELVVEEEDIIE